MAMGTGNQRQRHEPL